MYGKDLPLFLTGLSMGGMTSYRLALDQPYRYKGVVLMAPAIMEKASKPLKMLAKVANKILPKLDIMEQKRGVASKNP